MASIVPEAGRAFPAFVRDAGGGGRVEGCASVLPQAGGPPEGRQGLSRGCFSLLFWRAPSVFTAALRLSAHRGGRGRHQLPAPVCVRKASLPGHPPGAALLCGPAAHSQLRAEQNLFLAPFIRPAVTTEAPKGKDVTTPTRQARPPVRPDSLHLGRVLSLLLPGPRV